VVATVVRRSKRAAAIAAVVLAVSFGLILVTQPGHGYSW